MNTEKKNIIKMWLLERPLCHVRGDFEKRILPQLLKKRGKK